MFTETRIHKNKDVETTNYFFGLVKWGGAVCITAEERTTTCAALEDIFVKKS